MDNNATLLGSFVGKKTIDKMREREICYSPCRRGSVHLSRMSDYFSPLLLRLKTTNSGEDRFFDGNILICPLPVDGIFVCDVT